MSEGQKSTHSEKPSFSSTAQTGNSLLKTRITHSERMFSFNAQNGSSVTTTCCRFLTLTLLNYLYTVPPSSSCSSSLFPQLCSSVKTHEEKIKNREHEKLKTEQTQGWGISTESRYFRDIYHRKKWSFLILSNYGVRLESQMMRKARDEKLWRIST